MHKNFIPKPDTRITNGQNISQINQILPIKMNERYDKHDTQCFFFIFLSQAFGSTIQILSSKIKFFQAISKNHYKSAFYLFLYV